VAAAPEPLSAEWWLGRLYKQLIARQKLVTAADRWYSGPHPAPAGYKQAQQMLNRLLSMTGANFVALVVDAAVERLHVEGFKIGGQSADDLWNIWQSNSMDLGSEMVFLESLACGEAAMLVSPELNSDGYPTITPEHPLQTIVECVPGRPRLRAAGLKLWIDDMQAEKMVMATVYLPDEIVTFTAPAPKTGGLNATRLPKFQEIERGAHDLGEVPLVAFPNRPRMIGCGTPEFDRAVPIQQRINKTILDRLVMQDFSAFRQKWMTGVEIPVDPETNQPIEAFKAAVDRVWAVEAETAHMGTFDADDIGPLLAAVADDAKHMAAVVPTPPHYLLGDLVNLSAEALKAAEAALVSRVRAHMRHLSEPAETVGRLALRAAGKDSPQAAAMETYWRNPEFRTEGELVDALTKMRTLGVPLQVLWERWGATPQEIEAWPGMLLQEKAQSAFVDFLNAPAPTTPPASPPPGQ
jgi:hypothetical protein